MAEQVLIAEIFRRGLDHALRADQPVLLPVETAIDHPLQDSPALPAISFCSSSRSGAAASDERHDVEAALGGFIDVVQHRLVVADHDQLECRHVGEEIVPHEAGGDRIAASQRLDACLGPCAAFLGLARGHKPCAGQHREIGRVLVAGRGRERFHRRRDGIVLQDRRDGVEKHRLAVAAGAVDEHQRVLARDAGQAIAAPLLQKADQLAVVPGRLDQKT